MNKHDLHDNWDAIVTDPELTHAVATRHLATLKDGFSFALGRYVVCATGGSTGFRSVIAIDVEGEQPQVGHWSENPAFNRSWKSRKPT